MAIGKVPCLASERGLSVSLYVLPEKVPATDLRMSSEKHPYPREKFPVALNKNSKEDCSGI